MKRPDPPSSRLPLLVSAGLLSAILVAGCGLDAGPDEKATQAEIRVEGEAPNPLLLITSRDFIEQFNTETLQYGALLLESDTLEVTLPFSATVPLDAFGSIYVELHQPAETTASVHIWVDLDNGEGYEQQATLTDRASLIYYFIDSRF